LPFFGITLRFGVAVPVRVSARTRQAVGQFADWRVAGGPACRVSGVPRRAGNRWRIHNLQPQWHGAMQPRSRPGPGACRRGGLCRSAGLGYLGGVRHDRVPAGGAAASGACGIAVAAVSAVAGARHPGAPIRPRPRTGDDARAARCRGTISARLFAESGSWRAPSQGERAADQGGGGEREDDRHVRAERARPRGRGGDPLHGVDRVGQRQDVR